jgi:hypothetical protein
MPPIPDSRKALNRGVHSAPLGYHLIKSRVTELRIEVNDRPDVPYYGQRFRIDYVV